MKILQTLGLLGFISFSAACTTTTSVHPLGKDATPLVGSEWRGTWIAQDGAMYVDVIDDKAGIIEVTFIDKGKPERRNVSIRHSDKATYMNIVNEDKQHYFAKYIKKKNQLVVWIPSSAALKSAIENKSLKGYITKEKDLVITADQNSLDTFFSTNSEKMLFDYEEPLVLRRNIK